MRRYATEAPVRVPPATPQTHPDPASTTSLLPRLRARRSPWGSDLRLGRPRGLLRSVNTPRLLGFKPPSLDSFIFQTSHDQAQG